MGRIIRIDGKYYDTKTSNKSFLQVAKDLKTAGVKNWYFCLEIVNPYLTKIDPHATDKNGNSTCTKDQVEQIITECEMNIWYYLREVVRIPTAGVTGGVPYIANRGNIAQTWCLLHGIDSWLCLCRQQGKTKSALAALTWAYSYGTKDSTIMFVNKEGTNAKINLRDFLSIIDDLPQYMRFECILEEDGSITKARRSATKAEHPITHNKIELTSRAVSYEAALSMGRGWTSPLIHFDKAICQNKTSLIAGNFYHMIDIKLCA